MTKFIKFLICIVIITVTGITVKAEAKVTHKVYLTAKENNGIPDTTPQTEFRCSDKIYTIIEVSGLSKSKHQLEAVWTDPNGKKREHTKVPLYVSQDSARTWVWLSLHRPLGATVVTAFDPAYGMEEFIGDWNVSIYIDNKQLDNKQFSVLC